MSLPQRYRKIIAVAACCSLGALAACSDPDSEDANAGRETNAKLPAVKVDPDVQALVPDQYKDKGKIVIATNSPNAPIVFFKKDNKTLTGYTIDLGDAIAATMGLEVDWKNISFDSILPGLAARRYDAAMSAFSIEHERLDSADFVSYYLSGGGFVIRKGTGIEVRTFEDTCGHKVAVKKGVSQVEALTDASAKCEANGGKPVDVLQVPDTNAAVLALQSARADILVSDKPQALYAAQQSAGKLCVTSVYQTSHSIAGIAIQKGSTLAKPLQAAVNSLLKSGAYDKIGDIWGAGVVAKGTELSAGYQKVAAPWGVGPDGHVVESKIFTNPAEIKPGHTYYYQPLRKGCA